MRAFSVLVFMFVGCVAGTAWCADWPQFRGVGGQGRTDEQGLPVNWGDEENLAWRATLPGYGASSPITLDGRIYLTCYSGYGLDEESPGDMQDLRLHLVCLDAGSGDLIWDKAVSPVLPEEKRIRDHGYAAATPATDGKHIYVFFGKTGVFQFDLDGNQGWQQRVGDGTHGWGCGTSPVLFEDLVIVNASVESGKLVALHKNSGKVAWEADGMQRSWNTPHLVEVPGGETELVVSVKGSILAYRPQSGESLWRCDGVQDYVCPSIVSHDGVVYVIGGRKSMTFAVRAGGRGDVTSSHLLWQADVGANVSSPVVWGDFLYWVSDRNRTAYCVRRDDGKVMYRQRFPGQPYASTTVGDGKLYVVTRYDGTYVLAATPEYRELSHNEFADDTVFNASPVISNGALLIRSDQFLYCVQQ